jgi:hypothetical protein
LELVDLMETQERLELTQHLIQSHQQAAVMAVAFLLTAVTAVLVVAVEQVTRAAQLLLDKAMQAAQDFGLEHLLESVAVAAVAQEQSAEALLQVLTVELVERV